MNKEGRKALYGEVVARRTVSLEPKVNDWLKVKKPSVSQFVNGILKKRMEEELNE